MPSAFLRKLSLSAEQNWHQNSGANRRDVIRLLNMDIPGPPTDGIERPAATVLPQYSYASCSMRMMAKR